MKLRSFLFLLCLLTILGIWFQRLIPIFTPALNRGMGIFMAFLMLYIWRKKRLMSLVFCSEMRLWIIFLFWAGFTSLINARNTTLAMNQLIYLVQLTAIILAIISLCLLYKSIYPAVWLLVFPPLVYIIFLYTTRQTHLIWMTEGGKLGDLENPNTIGFIFFAGIAGLILLWLEKQGKAVRIAGTALILLFFYVIFQTGSRKTSIVILLFFLGIYYLLVIRREKRLNFKHILVLLISSGMVFAFIEFLLPVILENTYAGTRFVRALEFGSAGDESRMGMYREALDFFLHSPIWGIGLDQFKVYSKYGLYSHSDFAEILAGTGIIGFFLYFGIFYLQFRKLLNIRRFEKSSSPEWNRAGILLALLVAQMTINLGSVGFISLSNWVNVSLIIGYTTSYRRNFNGMHRDKKADGWECYFAFRR